MRTVSESGPFRTLAGRLTWLTELGTAGYPPKAQRRLRNINVGCYIIAISCGLFALTFLLEDAERYRWAAIMNVAMLAASLTVPALHRIHEVAGAFFIAFVLMFGLFAIVAMMGRDSGIQMNFVGASAMAFVVLELKRLRSIALIIGVAIVLHVASWLMFSEGRLPAAAPDPAFLLQLYVTTVVTISIIVAVLVFYAFRTAEQAEAETETLLHRMLPEPVAARLKATPDAAISDSFTDVAVLFSDIVGFVPISRRLGAERTVAMLNDLVHGFDRLAEQHGVEKIKTIGDAYMAVSGVPEPAEDYAARIARMALAMRGVAEAVGARHCVALQLRIGIALGPVMAGIIGAERFGYDIWGDAVNLAARLESSGKAGRIQVSKAFRDALADDFAFALRGVREMKGLGAVETYYLLSGSPGG